MTYRTQGTRPDYPEERPKRARRSKPPFPTPGFLFGFLFVMLIAITIAMVVHDIVHPCVRFGPETTWLMPISCGVDCTTYVPQKTRACLERE